MITERRSNRSNDDEDARSFIGIDIHYSISKDNDLESLLVSETVKSIDIKKCGRRICCCFLA